jgi:hypothetical protein
VCGVCGGVGGLGGVGCCRVGSLLTFDIPQTALVATLDTYDLYIYNYNIIYITIYITGGVITATEKWSVSFSN